MQVARTSVVVTGASAGIGAAVAEALGRRACRVALVARRGTLLEDVAERVRQAGGSAHVVAGDVRSADTAARAVAAARSGGEPFGGVIHCAGILGPRVPIEAYPAETFREVFDVHVVGAFELARAALPALRARGAGFFVALSSWLGRHGAPECAGYVAAKFALEGFVRALAAETADTGLCAVTVAPGMVATEMLAAYLSADDLAAYRRPAEVGEAIVRLAEDLRSDDNGAALDVDPWLAAPA